MSTDVIAESVGSLFDGGWPDDPLWICAVRQRDGRRVVFGRDVAATPAARRGGRVLRHPGLLPPGRRSTACAYIDGGVHSPTNADVLIRPDMPLDLVLISSPMSVTGRVSGSQPTSRPAAGRARCSTLRPGASAERGCLSWRSSRPRRTPR